MSPISDVENPILPAAMLFIFPITVMTDFSTAAAATGWPI